MPQAVAIPVAALLTSLGASAAVAGAIGSAVGSLAFAAGVGLVGQALTSKPKLAGGLAGAQVANSPAIRGSIKQATPAQRIPFGTVRVGGAFYFYEVDPPFLYVGLMHSAMPVTSYDRLFVSETEVPLDASGKPIAAPYLVGSSTARLEVLTQLGLTLDQVTNPMISTNFPALGANFRLPGIANSVFKFDYGADFTEFQKLWGQVQIPDVQWVVKGAPVPDPRNPAHIIDFDPNNPAELWAAIATWEFTENASLIQAFWAAMPFGLNAGPPKVYSGIAGDRLKLAADYDDESIPLKNGGFRKRHTIGGVVSLDQNPLQVMEDMLTATGGFASPRGGSVTIASTQPENPVFTITEDMVLAGFTYRDRSPKRDLVNHVRSRFLSSERDYQESDAPSLKRDDLIATDGATLEVTIDLPFTTTHQEAQRRQKYELERARLGRNIAATFDMRVLGLVEGTVCRFQSENFPAANGVYEVVEWGLADNLTGVGLALVEYDASLARAWTASDEEQDFELTVEEIS
jgi:hypothetical protein